MSATPFETFVDQVNDWMPDEADPVSETEALDVWSLGQRNPACAAAQIESLRRLSARKAPIPFGEIVTGSLLVPAGMALVALFSLADEADAAMSCAPMVASNAGVLSYTTFGVLVGLALGYVLCWWLTAPRVHDADDEAYGDLPHVSRVVEISSRRARS